MTEKQYASRDIRALGKHYTTHVEAMTAEGLHAKSAIAAELAHRDAEIERQAAAELEGTAGFDIDSLNGLLREMLDAMERYEMDTHDTPPFEHRKLMDRARLAVAPND